MLDKIKEAFAHPKTQDDASAISGHHDRRSEVSVDKARHAEEEELADQRIGAPGPVEPRSTTHTVADFCCSLHAEEREAEQASSSQPWQAPVIRGGRESLDEAAHHHGQPQAGTHAGHPDLQGGTHIPESELKTRFATVHTALRPNDPDQPGVGVASVGVGRASARC